MSTIYHWRLLCVDHGSQVPLFRECNDVLRPRTFFSSAAASSLALPSLTVCSAPPTAARLSWLSIDQCAAEAGKVDRAASSFPCTADFILAWVPCHGDRQVWPRRVPHLPHYGLQIASRDSRPESSAPQRARQTEKKEKKAKVKGKQEQWIMIMMRQK